MSSTHRKANCRVKKQMSLADYNLHMHIYFMIHKHMPMKTALNSPSLATCQCFFCIQEKKMGPLYINLYHGCFGVTQIALLLRTCLSSSSRGQDINSCAVKWSRSCLQCSQAVNKPKQQSNFFSPQLPLLLQHLWE